MKSDISLLYERQRSIQASQTTHAHHAENSPRLGSSPVGDRHNNSCTSDDHVQQTAFTKIQHTDSSLHISLYRSLGSSLHCVPHLSPPISSLIPIRVSAHPTLNFTVVINPFNGPGPDYLPDANYTREIPGLNAVANVRTLGYVSTNYTKRDLKDVLKDIDTYANWTTEKEGMGMRGIFLDETPGTWTDESGEFLEAVAKGVRTADGLGTAPLVSLSISLHACI